DPAGEAELLRQPEREAERHRGDIVLVAAERVLGHMVARPDTGGAEAAQIVAADEVAILDPHLLANPVYAADLAAEAQRPFRRQRNVIGGGELGADVADVAAEAGEVGSERDVVALMRIADAVAAVIEQLLADR